MNKFFYFFVFFIFLTSCSIIPKSRIDLTAKYSWHKQTLILNPKMLSFESEGELSLRVKGKHYNVLFEMFSKDEDKWRMEILGPFNMHLATIIINGNKAFVFHNDKWDNGLWRIVSQNTFGVFIPAKVLSAMVGGKFKINGQCTKINEGTLCREDIFSYYLIEKNNNLIEIRSVNVYLTRKKNHWIAVKNMKKSFEMIVNSTKQNLNIKDSLFQKPTKKEKNLLDEI